MGKLKDKKKSKDKNYVKEKKGNGFNLDNLKNLFETIINIYVTIIFILCFGILSLYTSKVGYSNVLPVNFDINYPDSKITDINITRDRNYKGLNIFNTFPKLSNKVIFNYNEKSNYNIYEYFNNHKLDSNLMIYYKHVFGSIITTNNKIINTIYSLLYTYLPEWLIILIFGFYFMKISIIIYIINIFLSIIMHIYHLKQMFRLKVGEIIDYGKTYWDTIFYFFISKKINKKEKWKSLDDDISISIYLRLFGLLLWSLPIIFLCYLIIPIISTFYFIFGPLYYTNYNIINKEDNIDKNTKSFTKDFIKETFFNQLVFIIILQIFMIGLNIVKLNFIYKIGYIIAIIIGMRLGCFIPLIISNQKEE